MRRQILSVWSFTFSIFAAGLPHAGMIDTLQALQEFDSSIKNPTAIEWNGKNFWISEINDSLKAKLNGGWNWMETQTGKGKKTPSSEHYSITLFFEKNIPSITSDSIGYRIYRNDSLLLSAVAPIEFDAFYRLWSVGVSSFGPHIVMRKTLISGITDTLVLWDGSCDGYVSTFVKQTVSVKNVSGVRPESVRRTLPAGSCDRFTILGRRLPPRQGGGPVSAARIEVSRFKAEIAGIRKK